MIAQFKTADGQFWSVNTESLKWHRFAEKPTEGSAPAEHGELTFMGSGTYALTPLTPPSLAVVGFHPIEMNNVIVMFMDANVDVFDFTLPVPIKEIRYQVVQRPRAVR